MSRIHLTNNYGVIPEGMLDFSSVNGTWVNCFGTLSPWGTPLSGEELYFDNTADWYSTTFNPQAMANYLGYPPDGRGNWHNPYDIGYNVEVGIDGTVADANEANVEVNKLELLGRFSHENAVVMPDRRTVFQTSDGGNQVLFKFVSNVANDLSSGIIKDLDRISVPPIDEAAFCTVLNGVGGELAHYMETVGGGNEFRENDEVRGRFFGEDGELGRQAIAGRDVYGLITPSLRRALDLKKAYMTIVRDQDYLHGRDANLRPAENVYREVDPETAPVLPAERTVRWDMRLQWPD